MLTCEPTVAPSSWAVVCPSTTTCACSFTCFCVKKTPSESVRALAMSHPGELPCTVVDQLELVLTSVAVASTTGATAATSGTSALSSRPATSCMVSVFAEPDPPRTPKLEVLPGEIVSRLVPSAAMRELTELADAVPMPTVQMTAATPKRMPSVVRIERSR
jgi:hypothetical protein